MGAYSTTSTCNGGVVVGMKKLCHVETREGVAVVGASNTFYCVKTGEKSGGVVGVSTTPRWQLLAAEAVMSRCCPSSVLAAAAAAVVVIVVVGRW